MKPEPRLTSPTYRYRRTLLRETGTTLVEVMIAMLVFTMVSTAILTSLIQLRKQGETNISQVLAQSTAEGILEQVRRASYADLSDFTNNPPVEIFYIDANSANRASVVTMNQGWAADDVTFTEVGALSNPSDETSPRLGVLMDVDYQDSGGKVIRPRRYMRMKINLTRTENANKDAVQICLRYQWAIPNRLTSDGSTAYYPARELRTVVSKMPTY